MVSVAGPNRQNQLVGKRYRIQSLLGEGAWNHVYLARDEKNSNVPVAVKILKPSAFDSEDTVMRFQREVQLTQQLDHRNIVRVYSSGLTEDDSYYLVTEYCSFGDLEQYIRSMKTRRGVPYLRAINILRFISQGLAHAHERKVLHRDLKPENILLTNALGVKIADFGIARSLRFESTQTANDAIGTPSYMAPEQFDGTEIGPWSDVYSVGILAYHLLSGELPFNAESNSRLMYQHCYAETPALTVKESGIPCWIEDIVHKACEKNPADRFADGEAFRVALEEGFAKDLRERWGFARALYFIQPGGKFCTYLTEKGVSRKHTKKILAATCIGLLMLGFLLLELFIAA